MKIIERQTLIFLIVVLPIAVLASMLAPESYRDSVYQVILVGIVIYAVVSGLGWSKQKKKGKK